MKVQANETDAARRRVFFHLVDADDGTSPENGEHGGQPEISVNGGGWSDTGIGTLVLIGHGRYYAELTQGAVGSVGTVIETRYKSAATAECPGDTAEVVDYDPYRLVGSAQVTTYSPVAQTGNLTIEQGDDYLDADGRAPQWTDTSSTWPDLTGATITFKEAQGFTKAVTCINPGNANQILQLELTKAETAALAAGRREFEIEAVLASGSVVTLFRGHLTVRPTL